MDAAPASPRSQPEAAPVPPALSEALALAAEPGLPARRAGPRALRPTLALTLCVLAVLSGLAGLHLAARSDALPAWSRAAQPVLGDPAAVLLAALALLAGSLLGTVALIIWQVRPALAALARENARMGAVLNSIADGVILRDAGGRVILANPAAVELLKGAHGFDPAAVEALLPDEEGGAHQRIEIGRRTMSVSLAPVHSARGERAGDVLVLRDVTLEAVAERTRDSFLDNIGHELRTPLTVIKGYVDVIRLGGERLKPEVLERALNAIQEQTQTLARMINDIIDLTNMREGGKDMLQPETVDLTSLVDEALRAWGGALGRASLVPQFARSERALLVEADPRRMRRAFDALFHNACHFSPGGGTLALRTAREGDAACFVISDPGVGIAEKDLPHIFERFYRGEPVGRDGRPLDVRGVGQGLYAVKTIVEAHGGSVEVSSQPGAGTTFAISLPLAGEQTAGGNGRRRA